MNRPRNTVLFDANGNVRGSAALLVWGGGVWFLYWLLGVLGL